MFKIIDGYFPQRIAGIMIGRSMIRKVLTLVIVSAITVSSSQAMELQQSQLDKIFPAGKIIRQNKQYSDMDYMLLMTNPKLYKQRILEREKFNESINFPHGHTGSSPHIYIQGETVQEKNKKDIDNAITDVTKGE